MDRFEHGCGAAGGVDGAIDPGVAVIADDDPVVGVLDAFDLSNYVPDDAALIVLLRDQVDLHAARPQVIAEGQRALPAQGHARAFEGLENGRGIVIAEGDGDDVGLVAFGPLFGCVAGGVGQVQRGGHAGGLGVAGILEDVLD
jgi:hypothetical protein